jgi:hypothetical protein
VPLKNPITPDYDLSAMCNLQIYDWLRLVRTVGEAFRGNALEYLFRSKYQRIAVTSSFQYGIILSACFFSREPLQ